MSSTIKMLNEIEKNNQDIFQIKLMLLCFIPIELDIELPEQLVFPHH